MAVGTARKPPVRFILGLLLSFIVTLVFILQVNLVKKLDDRAHGTHFLVNISAQAISGDTRRHSLPNKTLKETSVNYKKPPPPRYSNDSFKDCKLLRPNDYIYQYGPWDGAPIVIQSHRLVFFTIPKVGSTVLKQLFRRMEGYKDYLDDKHPLPHAPKRNGLIYLYDYSPRHADAILTDPTYTRAIFLRDPKERLLSAYLDKGRQNSYMHFHCCKDASQDLYQAMDCAHPPREHFGPGASHANKEEPLLSFEDFLTLVVPSCNDPHWQPQADRMESKYWKKINFVGHMETIERDTRRLLERIGAWHEFGASGWPNGHVFAGSATVSHKTDSSKRLKEYFTPEIELLAKPLLNRDHGLPVWQSAT